MSQPEEIGDETEVEELKMSDIAQMLAQVEGLPAQEVKVVKERRDAFRALRSSLQSQKQDIKNKCK